MYNNLIKEESSIDYINIVQLVKSDKLIIRINIFFSLCSILRLNIIRTSDTSILDKLIFTRYINHKIKQFNKEKFLPLFTSENNKLVIDELNRNMRVIDLSLRDYFSDNIMKRELNEIINE